MRIAYNDHGQPLTITEAGYRPAMDGNSAVSAIERTTTYRYAAVNGRQLLKQIDGPLPNGPSATPADSDITQINYDKQGSQPIEVIAPGNQISRMVAFDAAGYPIAIESSDGIHPAQQVQMTYNAQGQLVRVLRKNGTVLDAKAGGSTWSMTLSRWFSLNKSAPTPAQRGPATTIDYDLQSRLSRLTRPDGTWLQAEYDAASRLIAMRDQDGNLVKRELNNENRLMATLAVCWLW